MSERQRRGRVDQWPTVLRVPWLMLSEFVDHVLLEPYREGHVKRSDWPRGMVTIAVIALAAWVGAVALIVFAGPLRAALPLYVSPGDVAFSFPRPLLWVFFVLLILALSLVQAAAMHVTAWLSALVTSLTVLIVLFLGVADVELESVSAGRMATVVTSALLVAFVLARRRAQFAWWEFAVVFAVLGVGLAVALARTTVKASELGSDAAPLSLSVVMFTIGQLAIPSAIVAGSAVAEVATSSALRAVGVVRRHLPVVALAIGLVLLVVWRGFGVAETLLAGEAVGAGQFVASALLVAVIVTLIIVLARRRGRGPVRPPSATDLTDRLGAVAQPIAAGLAITFGPFVAGMLLFQVLFAYLGESDLLAAMIDAVRILSHSTTISLTRLAVGIVLIVLAVRWARQRRVVPELLGTIGVVIITIALASLTGSGAWLWSAAALSVIASLVCAVLLVWFLATRTLTLARTTGLAVALLLTALFQQRDFVSDPLGAILGFTGVAFVLFGYVWGLLTSGSYANKGTRAYPRPSRILIFFASTLFGVTVLAYTALARDPDAAINLGAFAVVGDQVFGTAILIGALVSVVSRVVADREPEIDLRPKPSAGPAPVAEPAPAAEPEPAVGSAPA